MKKIMFAAIAISLLNFSCSSGGDDDMPDSQTDPITYTNTVKAIMTQTCATSGCHNAASNSGSITLETFAQTKAAFDTGTALDAIVKGRMPKTGSISSVNINKIKSWIANNFAQ